MGLCGSVEDSGGSPKDDEDDVVIDDRPKIDTVVVNWNMAGINENAYVVTFILNIFKYTHNISPKTDWSIKSDPKRRHRRATIGTWRWNSLRCCPL
jgi:hypothetical protein